MPKKKKIKKVKLQKPRKPKKETKLQKANKEKLVKFPSNQLNNLSKWMDYFFEHKKFPHTRIICSHCKNAFVSLKGIALKHAMKAFDNDAKRILTESLCKDCKSVLVPKVVKEREPKVYVPETAEEREARYDEIRKTIPKIDFNRTRDAIDLKKDKEACKQHTSFACHNPAIYLDFGCGQCSINKHCACPIKDINRIPDGRAPKFKKAVIKPKTIQ
jgi:hypothetical protein